jgi:hypothetical protein
MHQWISADDDRSSAHLLNDKDGARERASKRVGCILRRSSCCGKRRLLSGGQSGDWVSLPNLMSLTGATLQRRVPHEKTASAWGMKRLSP